ncbi:MAG: glycosyltransferase family 2 protein [bacterium]
MNKKFVNISIVLYKNNKKQIQKVINMLIKNLDINLYLIDNSPTNTLKELANIDQRIEYIFNNANLGYGKGHNIAMQKSIKENIKYHLVMNPDVYFEEGVLTNLYEFMEKNLDVGLVMPKVFYQDGNIQYLCKLLPTPFDLFGRRFLSFLPLFKKYIEKRNKIYELRITEYDSMMEVPYLSGCFMFMRVDVLEEVGLFDERFFMYLEDVDLSRRIHTHYKTVYYPNVNIYHEYRKDSYKNFKILLLHINSAIKYFKKWGWVFDKERKLINEKVLNNIHLKVKEENGT